MTTSQSIDSSRDVVKADTDLNKNDVGDDVRISDVKVKQEVEVSVNADPPTLLQTNLSKMDTDGVQQQTNISNVKAGDDTVVVKVEWTYDEDMYDESGIENKRENKPDVHITQLSDKMSNQKAVHVKKSMDCGLESVTMITHENAPSSETKSGSETNESMEVDRKDNVAMTTNISAAQISEARSSGSTPAMESDVTLATTPGLNFTDFIQEVKAGTKASNSVIVEKSTDKVETGNDKAGTVVMTTDSTPIINNVEESIVVVENITSEEIISSESPNSDKNIFLTNVTTENVNNSSMIDSIDLVPEQETVNVENIMSTNPASLVVPGVIETVIEASVSDNTSVSNDTKPEFVTMIILNDSEDNVGHQEVIGNKANQSKSTKPDKDMIREVQKTYRSSEALPSKQALLAYEFSDDLPEEQTQQLPLKKSKGAVMSLPTVKVYPTHMFGNTVKAKIKKRNRQKKGVRKFIFDNQKSLPNEMTKLQMSDTSDIVSALDLAPPTKKLMLLKGDAVQLFCLPGRRISSEVLSEMYTRSLVTHSNEDDYSENNKIYVVEQERKDNEVEEEKPIQKKKKLITARPEGLSVQVIDLQLKDTSHLVSALNLAPPTKQLMHWKETHDVKNLLSHPGRDINSRTFSKLFTKNMVTKFDVAEDEEEREENLELEPLDLSECGNGESENTIDNTVNETNGSVTS